MYADARNDRNLRARASTRLESLLMMMHRSFAAAALVAGVVFGPVTTHANDANPALRLTIYANGLTLIDEARTLKGDGSDTVRIEGVASTMIVDSVHLDTGGAAHVAEFALDSDILSASTLLQRAVGKTIRVVRNHPTTGAEIVEAAEVLSVKGGLILKIGDRIETSVPGRLVFDEVPDDLHAEPSLTIRLTEPVTQPMDTRLGYLATGIDWDAVYTVVLNGDHDRMDIEGRAKISNMAGLDLSDARVSLVAGDVARQSRGPQVKMLMGAARMETMAASAPPEPDRQELSAFHIYHLPGEVSIKDKETRQLRLLGADDVPVKRVLTYRGSPQVFGRVQGFRQPTPVALSVKMEGENENAIDQPLPGGLVRAYVRDGAGVLRFIGEDTIANTPVGNDVELNLGRAFNVTVARTQTDFKQLGDRTTEAAVTLTVKNGGDKAAMVDVFETIPGDWQILEQDQGHTRDGSSAKWIVAVAGKDETQLSYRVRVRR